MDRNEVLLIGKAGKDAKTGLTKNGKTWARVTVATSKKIKEEWVASWHNVCAWGKTADRLATVKKGDKLFVAGELYTSKYTDKNGVEKYSTEVTAQEVFVSSNGLTGEQEANQEFMDDGNQDIPF